MKYSMIALATALTLVACRHVEEIDFGGSGTSFDAYGDGIPLSYGSFTGVDILVVVDNSGSMQDEQEVLATAFFPLVNALTDPLPGWPHDPIDDMRVAVVSSDMGLSWGGNAYENGDGWPGDTPAGCGSVGDNGQFETYGSGKTINLQHDTIPCSEGASQCPTGWECLIPDGDVGSCQAPGGDGTNQLCPGMDSTWAETPDDDLAFQVACLSALGTNGCGFEQQLQAAAVALHREDQQEFVRDGALLAVIEVSDEGDCSIESNELFAEPEIQNLSDGKVNIACGNHPGFLYDTSYFTQRFLTAKNDEPGSVLCAAIVGVPIDDACQGTGDQIADCLDHPKMELDVVDENDAYFFEPACVRWAGDELVTKARPGRRFVDLAQKFGPGGYTYSICNEDWRPAAEEIATMIVSRLEGSCFPEQLPWDSATQKSTCQLFVEYVDTVVCPIPTDEDATPVFDSFVDASDTSHTRLHCPLPRLAAPLDCDQVPDGLDGLGWYYCENSGTDECPHEPRPAPSTLHTILGRPAAIRCPIDG
ncbi:MAG: hypothetical protein JRF63_08380 [Deltaproteobacteria bacterium]|nr:hypothetical protein [Deltaproteobacteria bacterium]